MENFQSDLSGRTGTVQVKSGMSIDSHLERCLLVQTAELYSLKFAWLTDTFECLLMGIAMSFCT